MFGILKCGRWPYYRVTALTVFLYKEMYGLFAGPKKSGRNNEVTYCSLFVSWLRSRVFSVVFSFLNWILGGSRSRNRVIFSNVLSEPACSLQFDLRWASPHRPVRNATHLRTICFLEFSFAFREIFVSLHVLLQLDLHWDSPKLPWGIQRICGSFVLETIIMPFE